MRISSILTVVFLLVSVSYISTISTGCANIIPPSGGPRDSLPPQLLSVTPKDSTLNFRSNRIVFTFDEYIDDPQDLTNNLLFTPTFAPSSNPEIAIKGKTMTLRLRDSLLPNTTYTFNFGNAIRDINEGNVLRNFTYVFSTGPTIDSLTVSGNVILAENGRVDSTLIVILHNKLYDSAVAKERPVYITKLDAAGNFRFRNLPKDTFAVYALGNPGYTRTYNPAELFAFANEQVFAGTTKDITLYAFRSETKTANNTGNSLPRSTNNNDKRLRFTSTPAVGSVDLQSNYVLNFQSPLRSFDSTKVALTVDSSFSPVAYRLSLDSARTALTFRSQWREGARYNIILDRDFAEDSTGRKLLKTDTLNFTTKKLSEYGTINIRIRNLDSIKNPVLQFVQNEQVVLSVPLAGGIYRSSLFNPGDYDLRILNDTNKNGRWDPGQFFGIKRQPELVKPLSRKLVVKAGLDNEFDVSL